MRSVLGVGGVAWESVVLRAPSCGAISVVVVVVPNGGDVSSLGSLFWHQPCQSKSCLCTSHGGLPGVPVGPKCEVCMTRGFSLLAGFTGVQSILVLLLPLCRHLFAWQGRAPQLADPQALCWGR